ncbi:hypothetical protein [Desulforegula conservatrix]|uniref:hypothetical protein n=1 Tax=Desulforegula conservatrix TaxID=153026 RepID=UPI00040A4A5E|nr:hypothetical protein [Desulforegula conservatrix]
MELSISNTNIAGKAYANRLQEPRQIEQREQAGQVSNVQSGQQEIESALQTPLQPARRAGDITSLDGSNRLEERFSLYASQGNALRRDIGALNEVFSDRPGVNPTNQRAQTESQSEEVIGGRLSSNAQSSGDVAQAAGQVQANVNTGGSSIRDNTATPEASMRNYGVVSALSGYREASMQIQPVPTIDQTV